LRILIEDGDPLQNYELYKWLKKCQVFFEKCQGVEFIGFVVRIWGQISKLDKSKGDRDWYHIIFSKQS